MVRVPWGDMYFDLVVGSWEGVYAVGVCVSRRLPWFMDSVLSGLVAGKNSGGKLFYSVSAEVLRSLKGQC